VVRELPGQLGNSIVPLRNVATDNENVDKLNAFLQASSIPEKNQYTIPDFSFGLPIESTGVVGWVSRRLNSQLQSTVSAVGLVWWVTSMASTVIHRMVRAVCMYSIHRMYVIFTTGTCVCQCISCILCIHVFVSTFVYLTQFICVTEFSTTMHSFLTNQKHLVAS
jgi:hypothetical protein